MIMTGDIRASNKDGIYTVLAIDGRELSIEFNDTKYRTTIDKSNAYNGAIKDKLLPKVYGVGYVGEGKYPTNKEYAFMYTRWKKYLLRHMERGSIDSVAYYHNYQHFAKANDTGGTAWRLAKKIHYSLSSKKENEVFIVILNSDVERGYLARKMTNKNKYMVNHPNTIGVYSNDIKLRDIYEDIVECKN